MTRVSRLALFVALTLGLAACDVFKSSAPQTQPCEKAPIVGTLPDGRVDTLGWVHQKTFYCRIDTTTAPTEGGR